MRLAICVRALSYLGSQTTLFDLWDVGVSRIQCVEIHFAELVVELLSKLPGKIIMAVEKQHTYTSVTRQDHSSVR